MAIVKPFQAFRPTRDKVGLFATRTYRSYSEASLVDKLNNNPYTFLQIINPDYKNTKKEKGLEKFKLIKNKFREFFDKKIIIKDQEQSFYIYQQYKGEHKFEGIIGAVSINDYKNGIIKKHEKTLVKREELFTKYLSSTGFNADPVLLSYKTNNIVNNLIDKCTNKRAEYEFTTSNKVLHKLWVVSDKDILLNISESFKKINSLYIADGHHRTASSARLSQNNNSKYFMSLLIDEDQLNIFSFNRIVKNINTLIPKDFLLKLEENFHVIKKENEYYPAIDKEISMYLEKSFYSLIPKKNSFKDNLVSKLSPSILSKNILDKILNLDDNNKDIEYINGKIELDKIKSMCDNSKNSIAFILKPISINIIKEIANNNLIMPPKSTYIEPKLRSGVTIYEIN
jgi:uncharacterized protein (DUF1015 family)